MRRTTVALCIGLLLGAADTGGLLGVAAAQQEACRLALDVDADPDESIIVADPDICSTYEREGEAVCGCRIERPTDEPFLPALDASAFLACQAYDAAMPDRMTIGLYPDFSVTPLDPDEEFLDYTTDVRVLNDELPRFRQDVPGDMGYDWIYTLPSPDARYVWVANSKGWPYYPSMIDVSLFEAASPEDPGWKIEHFLSGFTNQFQAWGNDVGPRRTLYLPSGGYFRLTLDTEPIPVPGGEIITIEGLTHLARRPYADILYWRFYGNIADSHVAFDYDPVDRKWKDRYATFMYNDALLLATRIMVMDLGACRTLQEGDRFACKTVEIFDTAAGQASNPVLNQDGTLVSFHRDFNVREDQLYGILHILKNPLAHPALLDACLADSERDGYRRPIDCSPLLRTEGTYDLPNRCPYYHCCEDEAIDCSLCTTIGDYEDACGAPREPSDGRNQVGFFSHLGKDYVFFGRSQPGEHLDIYRLDQEDGEFRGAEGYPRRITFYESSLLGSWTPTPFHKRRNIAPSAEDRQVTTDEDVPVEVDITAFDPEDAPIAYEILEGPAHGSLSGAGPILVYTPDADYNGTDSFAYAASDGQLVSEGTVSVGVLAVNDPPEVSDIPAQRVAAQEELRVSVEAWDVDGDPLTYTLLAPPAGMVLEGTIIVWRPMHGDAGPHTITLRVDDGSAPVEIAFLVTVEPLAPLEMPVIDFERLEEVWAWLRVDRDGSFDIVWNDCHAEVYEVQTSHDPFLLWSAPIHRLDGWAPRRVSVLEEDFEGPVFAQVTAWRGEESLAAWTFVFVDPDGDGPPPDFELTELPDAW